MSSSTDQLPWSEACERNKAPILATLKTELPETGVVLEIGAGTGQHAVYFSEHLPGLKWLPSDRGDDPEWWQGLQQRIALAKHRNLLPPRLLDVDHDPADAITGIDAIYSANTAHIMSWPQVEKMFALVEQTLRSSSRFLLYGPFNYGGNYSSNSNRQFDHSLRQRNPLMGLRDMTDICKLAEKSAMTLLKDHEMPANNRLLVFQHR